MTMKRFQGCLLLIAVLAAMSNALSQPRAANGGVQFLFRGEAENSVALVGDFNGWSKDETPLVKDSSGSWKVIRAIGPGIYQYKFVLDGAKYVNDPDNPMTIDNYNKSGRNSVFVVAQDGGVLLSATPPSPRSNPNDAYPARPGKKPVYLGIIWHQHQPLYVDPEKDQLTGPWVRTHATKDYYDMAAMLRKYPDVHCTINLTSSLLVQLKTYYVDRLGPYVDTKKNRVDVTSFWKAWKGKTDPWVDLALKNSARFDNTDKDYLYRNAWNAFGISEVMLDRFPQYLALKKKLPSGAAPGYDVFSEQELREIKFWFYLAYFDPDFLRGPVRLPDGSVCDLSDIAELRNDGKCYMRRAVTEKDCNRIVAEAYKVMANVIPVHKEIKYSASAGKGQAEIITTPYYHPILPLIYDTDLAHICQPDDSLPSRFSFPQDARAQVAKAVKFYTQVFNEHPSGMWPGEGSVAQPVLGILRENGILWTASDVKVLLRSDPPGQPNTSPFRFPAGNGNGADSSISLVFRDTELSDRIGFKYQNYAGEEAAEDFVQTILSRAPSTGEPDVLVTVILDGENAWEWYRKDIDGKEFLNALYRKLSKLASDGQVVTTTIMEYIKGNSARTLPSHPVNTQPSMRWLWPGSWINGNYDTWIGEWEENRAWDYLLQARQDLQRSGIPQPDPLADPPRERSKAWYGYKAWEAIYAAEGSDWFWWYGDDQTAPGGDKPFDTAFLAHLRNMYDFAARAGAHLTARAFEPIIRDEAENSTSGGAGKGAMARSSGDEQAVVFTCNASGQQVQRGIYIAGNIPALASWKPNVVVMYDDGTHGDRKSGDGIWSVQIQVPVGMEVQYKYTNSGEPGSWAPGEEFPVRHRTLILRETSASPVIIADTFGK
jgi:alpha-amylase/alpha-mannosidase (GH57 family)